jgi:hypothetical protein
MTRCGNTSRATVTAAFVIYAVRHLDGSITGKVRKVSMLYMDVTVSIKSKVVMREKLFAD